MSVLNLMSFVNIFVKVRWLFVVEDYWKKCVKVWVNFNKLIGMLLILVLVLLSFLYKAMISRTLYDFGSASVMILFVVLFL